MPLMRKKAPARVILREIRWQEATDVRGLYPTLTQINSKKKYMFQNMVGEAMGFE